jgi:UDP-N-acetylmuramoyl-tripeptide--D-alanyl-D-alanine ligase
MRTVGAIAEAVGGRVVGDPAVEVLGAAIDSRTLVAGELFVPIVAERDGHDFIVDAIEAGATAYLTERDPVGGTAIVVDDTAAALTALGQLARRQLPDRVVGITGSVGKTTVKDLAAAVLATTFRTTASVRSFNNELGVPLTLFDAPLDTEAVVVEMGARGLGHVAHLCAVARPTVGVVTTVGVAHTERFGSLDAVAQAKGELVEALPAAGTAVLNADVPAVAAMAGRTRARVVTFGAAGDVRATAVELDDELRPHFTLDSPWGDVEVQLGVRGEHQVANALAAAAAALACDVPLDRVADGLLVAEASPWRMDLRQAPSGAAILNDAYNANPASTTAALQALARLDADRRTAVLGPMAELGDRAEAEHLGVAARARLLGVRLIAVGAPAYGAEADHVADLDDAFVALGPLGTGDAVLIKGSRVAGLERLAERCLHPS